MSREVTETVPLICAPQAPLEMVLIEPLLPRPKKKPLIGQTHDDRANVGKIDKTNAQIVAWRDDKSEAHSGLSRKVGQNVGRSTHDESTFHIAERIPEGTKRLCHGALRT